MGSHVFDVRVRDIVTHECLSHPFKWKLGGGSRHASTLPPEMCNQVEGSQGDVSQYQQTSAAEPKYQNPDLLVQLLGCANDAVVMVDEGWR